MIGTSYFRRIFTGAALSAASLLLDPAGPLAATAFTVVAAGDMSADEAILWTRTVDAATSRPVATALTAQLAAEPEFRKILFTYKGATDPARAGTIKIEATGLNSHTRYFYRFVSDTGEISPIGRFTTAPRDDETVTVRFAFSGDAHGAWRPYPLVQRFGELNLDYFVFLGDTMYETASDLCISGRARSRWVCTLIPMMRASSSNKQYIGSAIDESSLMT
jgi:phosphodiesterase/alkaline phosphatase D-like protein